ncbi:MAG: hypothetical protein COY81_04100 [Candidatus Pacebacteria bacterium CG_4_10_14_0_8_um_filter_43_12]|nr:MAG: hypothetical protein COY81_04100 [Candidatus Pacebacteria bacterium CG_4_10_14_0_8_um_filter_43_12]
MLRLEAPPTVATPSLEKYFSAWLHGQETQLFLTTAGQVEPLLIRTLKLANGQDVFTALNQQKRSAIITFADPERSSIRGKKLSALRPNGSLVLKSTEKNGDFLLPADTPIILYLGKAPNDYFGKDDNLQLNST